MSRKHEIFNYDYGIKLAPEQWIFYLNGKAIRLDNNTRGCIIKLMENKDNLLFAM